MLKVAFLDDGIMDDIDEVSDRMKKYTVGEDGKIQVRKKADKYYLSHGTMCWWIFYDYVETKKICLYDIQVLDLKTQKTSIDSLLKALFFCLEERIDIINMSLGTTDILNLIPSNVLQQLYNQGTIIVAAGNNDNLVTYPACSPFVIGVICDRAGILNKDTFFLPKYDIGNINVISHCDFKRIEEKHKIVLEKANSFSTPYITALICNVKEKGMESKDIWKYLASRAVVNNGLYSFDYIKKCFPQWQDKIDIPVIVCDDTDVAKDVVKKFRHYGYNCVGIIDRQMPEYSPYLWGIEPYKSYIGCNEAEIQLIIFNASTPDLLIQCGKNHLEQEYDLLLCNQKVHISNNKNKILYSTPINLEKIVEEIKKFFE